MLVRLTWEEAAMAADVGRRRQLTSLRSGHKDKHGYSGDGWGIHIEGAMGEMVLAKHLGIHWDGSINTFKRDDLPGVQVRTRSGHHYDLIIRTDDDPNSRFVLVTGKCPNYRIRGWIQGQDGMQEEWLKDYGQRPKAYFVPQGLLLPLQLLFPGAAAA